MYIRMRKTKEDRWIKMEVNFLDYFLWNFIAGIILSLAMTVLLVVMATVIM